MRRSILSLCSATVLYLGVTGVGLADYDESVDGDLDPLSTSLGNLAVGANTFRGTLTATPPSDSDRFNVTLPVGLRIDSITWAFGTIGAIQNGEVVNATLFTNGNLFDDNFISNLPTGTTNISASFQDTVGVTQGTLDTTLTGSVWDFQFDGSVIFSNKNYVATITTVSTVANTAPTITSSATASVAENQTSAIDVQATDDNDSEGSGLTFSLSGGADQALFNIVASTGVVTFINAPDFEVPADAGADNNYNVQVTVTDSGSLTAVQDITITVTDVAENAAPIITSANSASVLEHQNSAIDVQATDDSDSEGSGLTFGLSGGADQGLFNIDAGTGVITFVNEPDFENPTDAGGDNNYNVQVTVTDSGGLTAAQDIVVTVTDLVCPAFPLNAADETEFNTALTCYKDAPAGSYEINVSSSITLTASPVAVSNVNGAALTINGGGNTIDGANSYRPITLLVSNVTVDNITLQRGSANVGGAIRVAGGATLTLTNSTITASTSGSGGGIRNDGTLHLHDSTLSNNTTTRSGEGGGLSNYGTAHVRGVTAVQNSGAFGAALYTRGTLTVSNSTLSNNAASALGGAIYVFFSGTVTIYNTTITGSSANTGGAILNNGGSMTAFNTIIANTTRGSNCFGAIGGTNNLTDDGSCGGVTQSTSINLGLLENNGGGTLTHALQSNSAAIDAGDDTVCAAQPVGNVDQRGTARPFNLACDIGAYEFVNAAPVLAAIGSQATSEGQLLEFTVSATDMEGGNLTFAVANAPTGATFDDNGDGTATFSWTPAFNQSGNYVDVLFTVTDNGLGTQMHSEAITITVGNVNRPPQLATVASQATGEGVMMTFDLLATDPDGDQIALALANAPTGASFTDLGGGSGQFVWTPSFDQSGNYTVMFTATDNGTPAQSDAQDVTLTVGNVNRPPVLSMIGSRTVDEGATLSFALMATDPDDDAMSYALGNGPQGASLTDNSDGTAIFSWTPGFGQAGNFPNVLFTVSDNGTPVASDSEAITITVGNVNRPPTLSPIGDRSVDEGVLLEFTLTATDPDGDNLSYAISNAPTGSAFTDNGDGTAIFSWTPGFGQAGNFPNVLFTVTDNGTPSESDSEIITITVGDVNRPPVLSMIGDRSIAEGELLEFTLTASDPEGNNLNYAVGNIPTRASFTDNGDGTATFSWAPDFTQDGSYPNVLFTVTDDGVPANSDTETITITVSDGNVTNGSSLSPVLLLLLGLAMLLRSKCSGVRRQRTLH